jgi:cytochrome c oxidase subunit IV
MSEHHIVPIRVYLTIFGALIVGTAITVAAAYQDFGALNNVIAMLIATTKATLVILYFMHIRYSSKLLGVVIAGSVFWFILLLVLTLSDFFARGLGVFPGRSPVAY